MSTKPIDLRSDTVTRPTPNMLQTMAQTEVGDDVFGDDPAVNKLQEKVAEILNMEAALFVPSGTMANQIALRTHTEPGDEIIAHANSHIYLYEGGGPAALSGCQLRLLPGQRGQFSADEVRAQLRPADPHFARPTLIVVENTHNRGGGSVWPLKLLSELCDLAREKNLRMHLDGARLMNACIASGISASDYARRFDTASICFSKSLGAPVGSALAGSKPVIERAKRFRKMFGGGMRQAGYLAAAAIYALDHHVDRLAEDHANAKRLGEGIADTPGAFVDPDAIETNMVYIGIDSTFGTAQDLVDDMKEVGVWALAESAQRIRAVLHLDVSSEDVDRVITLMKDVFKKRRV